MPVVFLDRLPLPSLKAYTALSVLLLSCSIYYAGQITSQPDWKANSTLTDIISFEKNAAGKMISIDSFPENTTFPENSKLFQIVYFMIQEPLCIWTLINMAYCFLILIGKFIQKLVFGELRVSEQQHIKDKFWNFVFYKFIFIFGVMNVQFIDEVVLWCSWFSVLGFLHLLAQLCKDRFEYLSFSPTTPKWIHIRLLILLLIILNTSMLLFVVCVFVGLHTSINTFAFMAAECVLLILRTLYVIVRYAIHLWDTNHHGVWENRGTYIYFTELIFELTALAIDFFHHLHMLLWSNIFLSMASLVICMQFRYLFYEMKRRIKKHKNYLRVVRHMEKSYPMALAEELENNSDDCAICWDKMESARKLPCGHLFHNSCLRSWLEQDTSCPTCRTSLSGHNEQEAISNAVNNNGNSLDGIGTTNSLPDAQPNRTTTNHFFHFDGSRYVSWLPSFSVEVTHTQLLVERQQASQTSQLDNMARQVQQMFPHMPLNLIVEDLRLSRSIEITIENILEERLVPPPFQLQVNRISSTPHISSVSQEPSPTADIQIEDADLERSSNVESVFIDDISDSDSESVNNDLHSSFGGRFSKSPEERERMLARRKEELLSAARKKYLAKFSRSSEYGEIDSASIENSAENRRHLAYEAAQRRLAQQQDST
uniref:E3 ubiquitin-protein ligase AMFR n=1 Tax=Scolopendra viridis TaxID=118503 RepID=A0A4D5R9Y2_SCOVI